MASLRFTVINLTNKVLERARVGDAQYSVRRFDVVSDAQMPVLYEMVARDGDILQDYSEKS